MHLTKAKVIAGFCALALALTATVPYTSGPLGLKTVAAAADSESGITTYDFRDGSVIPTDTDGKSDVTSDDGKLTVKVGDKNAYQYNGAQHGVAFKDGNSIEIKVDGSTKLTVGGCQYNNLEELTVKSLDGSYTDTQVIKTTNCYDKDGSAGVFSYTGDATTLILEFTNTAYVPVIITEPINEPVVDDKPSTYDFRDGSVIPTDTDGKSDVESKDGKLTVKVGNKNAYQYNGAQHGVAFKEGNSIEIKVNGPTKLTVGGCQYNNLEELTVKSLDGSYTDTQVIKTTNCYDKDGSAGVFTYIGDATTLVLEFTNTAYVPVIITEPITEPVVDDKPSTYDFRDGSVIPTDTDGKSDVESKDGKLTVKVGNKNAYQYNGAQHGVAFKDGNSIEIKVNGPTKLTVGGCQYNNLEQLTVKSADGSYTDTKVIKTANCYDKDGSAGVFTYIGEATTLIMEFTNTAYVPVIITEPVTEDVPDKNGVEKDTVYMYNFPDGTMVPNTKEDPVKDSITSKDGLLTINAGNDVYFHDNQHGIAIFNGNSFEVKVAGDSVVQFNLCEYGADPAATLVASAPKGEFVGETTQPLIKKETDGLSTVAFEYKGVATTLKFTVKAGSGEMYLHGINVSNKPETVEPPVAAGNGKIDVWDFGAEQLDSAEYNNMLTVDTINGFYDSSVAAGSSGVTIGYFATDELFFNPGGKTNNRIRTTNTNITRFDEKEKTIDGIKFTGYVYSNSSSPIVYLGIKLYENDVLTLYTGSNGGASTIYCESPSGDIQVGKSSGDGAKLTFNAAEYGIYKIYSVDEKLVVYRALREHTAPVKVSGSVDVSAAAGIENKDYTICFTNQSTGEATEAAVENGAYSVYLNEMYTYDLSLVGANGYIIKDNKPLEIAKGKGNVTLDLAIVSVDIVTVTGKLTGLSADALELLELSFVNKKYPYVPEFTISGTDFTVQLEKGVTYDIVAEGINDYELSDIKTISATADGTQNIAFALKPVYDINVTLDGIPDSAKSSAVLTFTNLNEEGYVYTFAAGEKVQLRDGSYTVKVSNIGSAPFVQKLTSNVNVNGAAVDKTIGFEEVTIWDFSKYNNKNPGIETIDEVPYYLGLVLTKGNVMENKTYLLVNADGEVKIPVKKDQLVTLEYCYCAAFEVEGKQVSSNSGSTSTFESVQVTASADGFMTVKGTGQTYFTKITVATPEAYKAEVTVGADKDYQTINDALAAVAKMARPDNERVKIVIDPGNYEEMLVVNIPNVSLVNAAGEKSSLEIINKGVDIGENVVRITGYYGHGYDYYSMGSDAKWNAEVLAANKENGSISTKNPGAGTTNGSYWNSTVVIYGNGFEADGIVFENSFNQYISKKEAEDTVVMWASGSKGQRPTTYGDTSVQKRSFVERAGALSVLGDNSVFNNCKFIGRQDTLYGGTNIKAVFQKCDILGAVDYIYGGMTAVFYQCNLVMNTDDKTASDQAYLTAPQQSTGRGYLMYNCTVTSTTPGVDTASETRSKPGYFGRPWQANTSEVVFYNTIVETTDYPDADGKSLIVPQGWNNTLGGTSPKMYEYGTVEKSGEDNSASRADWTNVLEDPYIDGGETEITIKAFLGDWTDELNERGLVLELGDTPESPFEDTDEDTGIEVTAPVGAFENPDDITFNAEPVDEETDNNKFTFDLSFTDKDGNPVQPNKAVTVKIPVPEALKNAKTIFVYHVEKDEKHTEISCKVEGGMVVFTASKFSKYIVTSEKLTSSGDTPSTPDNPGTPGTPGTPDKPDTPSTPSEGTSSASGQGTVTFPSQGTNSNSGEGTSSTPSDGTSTPGDGTSSAPGGSDPSNPATGVGAGMALALAVVAGSIIVVAKKKR